MQMIQKKNITSKTKKSITQFFARINLKSPARIAFSIFGLAILILLAAETSRAQQFCSTTPITIPASGSSGSANPYPSTINVSGLNGTISNMSVTLNNIQHQFANDVDILLVGPQGQKFIILSDAGGDAGFRNTPVVLTLSDAGTALVPNPIGAPVASGTYKPSNYGATADTFPSVAGPFSSPATAGSATFASVFNNTNPNGDWKLYAVDDGVDFTGSISGGWCLNLTIIAANPGQLQLDAPAYTFDEKDGTKQITVTRTNGTSGAVTVNYATSNGTATGGAACTAGVDYVSASGTLTFPDGVMSQTFPVTLCNDTAIEAEETFNVALSNPTGGATLGTPSAAVVTLIRVERFCTGTSITIPNSGSANPYPSIVNVSGLTGTISNVSVTLTNISHDQANDVDILLVGPNGQKFIILSDAGQRFGFGTPVTFTLADAGATHIPSTTTGTIPAGFYKPTNYDTSGDVFGAPAPPTPYEYPAPDGNQTFASVFSGTNPNGEWKLYVSDDNSSTLGGSIAGGWCLNISTVQATPGQFQFSASSFTFEENYINAVIGVRRTGGAAGAVSVNYATLNGTAVGGASCAPGIDYINTSGTLSFADGETGEKTFTVQMCRDGFDPEETVNLQLSSPTGGAVLGTPSAATLNIQNSLPSRFGFELNYTSTSDFQTQPVMVRIQRNNLSDIPVTDSVTYTTGGGTSTGGASCTAGVDYITTTGTVTLAPNDLFQDVPITICGDALAEQGEFFELTLSNPSPGADIDPSDEMTKVVIVDNQPTVYVVNTTSDITDGICDATRCTLYEAILAANGGPGADEIRFDPTFFNQPRTIEIEDAIQVGQNVSIIGTGTNFVRLDPTFAPVVFETSGNVSVRDLTITAFGGTGDAFYNTGTLNLTNIELSRMVTSQDGVVINAGGTVTMTNSSVIDNSGTAGGVTNSGGGVFNIVNSLIARNKGDLTGGGGVRNENGTVNITNSTISDNLADNAGAVYNATGTVNINHSTIYGNKQDDIFPMQKVGGILNASGATVNIRNSIVAGNLNLNNQPSDLGGAFSSQGYNLIGSTDGSTGIINGVSGDKAGTNAAPLNPVLAALADNGGLTQTRALMTGSPAIDAANPASDLTIDQRGFSRPFDGDANGSAVSDIGAFEFGASVAAGRTAFDFDGDGKADLSVFRPSNQNWYVNRSSNNQFSAAQFGLSTDRLVPADYDGDGRADLAVYRDGEWHISNSSNAQLRSINFGLAGDVPVPGDFDGDQKADISVFRPSDGTWYRVNSSNGQFVAAQFGSTGDVPVIGDFNGDGKSDLTVFRPSNGFWYIARTTGIPAQNFDAVQFGANGDKPVAADYDGDGKTDIAVFRSGVWYVRQSSANNQLRIESFGLASDRPAPADYDGDGKADITVYRGDGEWYQMRSTAGFGAHKFGLGTDKVIPSTYITP